MNGTAQTAVLIPNATNPQFGLESSRIRFASSSRPARIIKAQPRILNVIDKISPYVPV